MIGARKAPKEKVFMLAVGKKTPQKAQTRRYEGNSSVLNRMNESLLATHFSLTLTGPLLGRRF